MANLIGELRPGQMITTFGPGAIMDAKDDSVMLLDIKYWKNKGLRIKEPRLGSLLDKDCFYKPRTSKGWDLPVIPFPSYHVCSNNKCNNLFDINDNFNMEDYLRNGPRCPKCEFKAYPARFVVSCEENHLDDFPWRWWVHEGHTDCKQPMTFKGSGKTSTLDELYVNCGCKKSSNMRGATEPNLFKDYECKGRHPFRLQRSSKCQAKNVIPLQRGASNIYFPVLRSAISIPAWNNPLYDLINEHLKIIREYKEDFGEDGVRKQYNKYFSDYSWEEFYTAFEKIDNGIQRYSQVKEEEYDAIIHHSKQAKKSSYFKAEEVNVPPSLDKHFSRIIKVHRLREILVLLGFMRNEAPEPEVEEPKGYVNLESAHEEEWLPATEIHGEGIFIEINQETLKQWKESDSIKHASREYESIYNAWVTRKGWTNHGNRDAGYVMLHTLAHLLIKELSNQCGYSSTALKERIYYDGKKMAGILIYTGSTDKEGTLGGLVEMGELANLQGVLLKALEKALFCTNDPLCATLKPMTETLNGAACHACSMISETSCETGNRLLDRRLVISLHESNNKGFFEGLV